MSSKKPRVFGTQFSYLQNVGTNLNYSGDDMNSKDKSFFAHLLQVSSCDQNSSLTLDFIFSRNDNETHNWSYISQPNINVLKVLSSKAGFNDASPLMYAAKSNNIRMLQLMLAKLISIEEISKCINDADEKIS